MEMEFPRWVYPPDGGPGKVIRTLEDWPTGWLRDPAGPQSAGGERVIGMAHTHVPPPPSDTHVAPVVEKAKGKKP